MYPNSLGHDKINLDLKNIIDAVDGKEQANNYDRQIQGQSTLRNTFVILK